MGRFIVLLLCTLLCFSKSTGARDDDKDMYGAVNAAYTPKTRTSCSPEQPSGFIVGGVDTDVIYAPYHGSLQERDDCEWFHICGATLISRTQVLLAAHCVVEWGRKEYRVAFGWTVLSHGEANPGSQIFQIRAISIYPDFDPCSPLVGPNDIAVGFLNGKVNVTNYVSPIAVRKGDNADLVGESCQLVGWGISEVGGKHLTNGLKTANVTVISNDLCKRFWAIDPNVNITDDMLCAFDWPARRKSACDGDSGGGLVCGNELVGLVSFSNNDCNGCIPDVYTGVASYKRFLRGGNPWGGGR